MLDVLSLVLKKKKREKQTLKAFGLIIPPMAFHDLFTSSILARKIGKMAIAAQP